MRKSDFISAVSKRASVTQKETEAVLDAFCEQIVETTLEGGEEVSLPIGKFRCKVNPAREGVNPLTHKPMSVPESKTLAFKASKTLKHKE